MAVFLHWPGDDDILDSTICNRVAHRHEEEPLTAVDPNSEDNAPESVSDTESLVSRDIFQGPTVGAVVEEEVEPHFFEFRRSEAIRHAFVSLDVPLTSRRISREGQSSCGHLRSSLRKRTFLFSMWRWKKSNGDARSMMRQRSHAVGSYSC